MACYNNKNIKKLNLEYNFKLQFSNQSIFNSDEIINRWAKACQYGVDGKMYYASSLGMSPSDVLGMSYLENALDLATKKWIHPLVSSNTQSSLEEGGRPKETGTISESNEQTRESGANDNR